MIPEFSHLLAILSAGLMLYSSLIGIVNHTSDKSHKLRQLTHNTFNAAAFFLFLSFAVYIYLAIQDDFSVAYIASHSNSDLPIFYKVSSIWSAHEGSMFLWITFLVGWLWLFINHTKNDHEFFELIIIFSAILIFGFLLFLLATSSPFERILPVTPLNGADINPVLQDPALAIHPPILYLGYVGTSIIFSSALGAIISGSINKSWASHIKRWVLISWVFLSIGILLGSIWAYYELGWGGFWFWDPVENVSLMPWLCLTALLHTVFTLEKRGTFQSWAIILSITTFSLSMSGTFLVRSGILNSIHTFANDPSRGVFILCFLFVLIFISIFIYFFYQKTITVQSTKTFLVSKETAVLINNLFMMFFLSVVLIGTVYPIFLEVINDEKISIGPPFYHKLIIPFLIPFLFFMAIGPNIKWVKDKMRKINLKDIFIFIISIVISYIFVNKFGVSYLLSLPLFIFSLFLFFVTIKDFFGKNINISQKISHFGFSLLILSILLNGVLAKEHSSNMRVGDEIKFLDKMIQFQNIEVIRKQNYQTLIGKFNVVDENNSLSLKPEIRIYDQPETITSEADISSTIFADNFLVFNIIKDDGFYNVRYQIKPFMIWIWISVLLISLGGILSLKKKNV